MSTPARLTWADIRARAVAFARDWADGASERADAQTFWNEFLAVFGVHRRRAPAGPAFSVMMVMCAPCSQ